MAKKKKKKKRVLRALLHGVELGTAIGVMLTSAKHSIEPFGRGNDGLTYSELQELLKRDYCVDIDDDEMEVILTLFNAHPKTKLIMEGTEITKH